MADHPCSLGPPVAYLVDTEQVDVPVEVAFACRTWDMPVKRQRYLLSQEQRLFTSFMLSRYSWSRTSALYDSKMAPTSRMTTLWARSHSCTTSAPSAMWPPKVSLILLVDGLPCPQTTAYGFLKTSIPTAMQSCWEESPRFLAWPYPCGRSVSTM